MAIVEQWAGHFSGGGSDKVWAGAYTEDGHFLSTWGRRGAALASGDKSLGTTQAAAKQFEKKMREKKNEGYQDVPFDHVDYGIPSFGPTVGTGAAPSVESLVAAVVKDIKYQTGHVTPLTLESLNEALESSNHGVSEKVNGERCLVACDGNGAVEAYNRKGQKVSTVPEGARIFTSLGVQCVVDGERLTGNKAGTYIAFDLLEWDNQDARSWPYSKRISTLEDAMVKSGLIVAGSPTHNSKAKLHLLVSETNPAKGKDVIAAIKTAKGEGVIVRTHDATYQAGDTKDIRKYKYLADLDAIVIGVQKGAATGSVVLGLIRPSDKAMIEVCRVRSGLLDKDIEMLSEKVSRGEQPVLKVEYLPVRTVGIKLVEPKTSIRELRTDKVASECTTEQLGEEKAEMVLAAKAVADNNSNKTSLSL